MSARTRMIEPDSHDRRLLTAIVITAFAIRAGATLVAKSWIIPSDRHFWRFGYEMGQIAASIAMGDGFSWPEWAAPPPGPTSWMPPVYPLLMGAIFRIMGIYSQPSAVVVLLFQAIVSALTCVLAYWVGKHVFSRRTGLIAAVVLAVYPLSIFFAAFNIWSTALFTFCLLALIFLLLRVVAHTDVRWAVPLGLLMGFTALVDPIVISFYPFALIWLFLHSEAGRRSVLKATALVVLALAAAVSPWLIRNQIVLGSPTFVKSNFGFVLFLKSVSPESRREGETASERARGALTPADRERFEEMSEAERDRFLFGKALGHILEDPGDIVRASAGRFVRYWGFIENPRSMQLKLATLAYFVVLTLALAGIVLSDWKRREVQLLLLALVILPLPYYLTVAHHFRYRFHLEPILIVFAAQAVDRAIARVLPRSPNPMNQGLDRTSP